HGSGWLVVIMHYVTSWLFVHEVTSAAVCPGKLLMRGNSSGYFPGAKPAATSRACVFIASRIVLSFGILCLGCRSHAKLVHFSINSCNVCTGPFFGTSVLSSFLTPSQLYSAGRPGLDLLSRGRQNFGLE